MAGNDIEHLKQQQAKLHVVVLAQLTRRGFRLPSQYDIFISRYIAMVMTRCSGAGSRLPL